jgi:cobalamin-dependent methionine synthase I
MTMGIVNAGQLVVYDDIDPKLKKCVEDVVLNDSCTVTLAQMCVFNKVFLTFFE